MTDIRRGLQIIGKAFSLWWQDWSNQELVSLAFILLSLTVLGFAPALFGVFHQALDLTHGIRTSIAGWWEGVKMYLKDSLLWGLLNLTALAIFAFTLWFYANSSFGFAPYLVILISVLALSWFVWQFITLACYFLQAERSLKLAWKNGFAVLLSKPLLVLLPGLLAGSLVVLSVRFFIPLMIGSPALISLIALLCVQSYTRVDTPVEHS
ncbi:MAG TPA: hypothetical protein PLX92_01280 [Anaerolineaceae bacterium]|nr:hypothetical protein [Anaerolineaceae bacterium]